MNKRIFIVCAIVILVVSAFLIACTSAPAQEKSVVKETPLIAAKETLPAPTVAAPQATKPAQPATTPTAETFKRGGTLVVGVNSAPSIFDPADHRDRITETVIRQWADPLIMYWPDTKRHLQLAESIKQIEPKVWEVKLRKGITFHNGDPFTAADVKFTFERLIKDSAIEYPKPHISPRKSLIEPLERVEQIDEYTVRMHLSAVHPDFVSGLFSQEIVPKKYIETVGTQGYLKQPIGTGPFKFVQGELTGPIILERYAGYHGGPVEVPPVGAAFVDKVIFQIIPEASARMAALQKGEVDIAIAVPPQMVAQLKANPNIKIKTAPGTTVYTIDLNTSQPPFNDARVRRAMNHAVDLGGIVTKLFEGYAIPLAGPLGVHNQFYDKDLKPYGYDVKKAKDLLAEAGWKDTNGDGILDKDGKPFSVVLDVPPTHHKDVAEAVANQLAAVGIEAKVRLWESAALTDAIKKNERIMYAMSFGDARGDPYSAFDYLYRTGDANNRAKYSNPQVDKLIESGRTEADPAKRRAIYLEAQRIVYNDAPTIFAYQLIKVEATRARVQNWEPNPTDRIDLYRVWLSQ
ncbi:MAG: ABC transporter substrate-binding protein [Anaerolineales bacterium]|nr:ABC transporter substrate-binding protein [Anaerolineales bacterium]